MFRSMIAMKYSVSGFKVITVELSLIKTQSKSMSL